MRKLWYIPVAGAVLAPLVTWWPMLAYRFPWTGLPRYQAAQGIDFWSAQTFWLVAITMIAVMIGREDRWLGMAVALAGMTIFFRGAAMDPTHSVLFTFGAVMVVAMRRAPQASHVTIKAVLVAIGAFELLYVLQQQFLAYDLLWGPLFGGQLAANIQALGTIGTVDGAAAYLAILAPLMPLWMLPLVMIAVFKSHAVSALLALGAGLGWKYRRNKVALAGCLILIVGAVYYSGYAKSNKPFDAHMQGRGAIWGFAVKDWVTTDPIVGYGLGGWSRQIPAQQVEKKFAPTGELWREAHNEYLQWLTEAGVIGLAFLGFWLWQHRAMFSHPMWGPSLAALGVNALTFFPMHVVQIALVGLILVGLATAPTPAYSTSPQEWGAETGD